MYSPFEEQNNSETNSIINSEQTIPSMSRKESAEKDSHLFSSKRFTDNIILMKPQNNNMDELAKEIGQYLPKKKPMTQEEKIKFTEEMRKIDPHFHFDPSPDDLTHVSEVSENTDKTEELLELIKKILPEGKRMTPEEEKELYRIVFGEKQTTPRSNYIYYIIFFVIILFILFIVFKK